MKFRHGGITQKKEGGVQNMAEVLNHEKLLLVYQKDVSKTHVIIYFGDRTLRRRFLGFWFVRCEIAWILLW